MAVRVVIAEDEAILRMDLREILESEGYEVVGETGRGDEVVDLVAQSRPDLAILDVKMPGLDGITAARRVGEQGEVAVLLLTAFSQRDLVEAARDAGVLAYLVKPFQREELIPAIEIALARFSDLKALQFDNTGLAKKNAALTDRLETRTTVDRAKGILIDNYGLRESEAFAFIQRRAMDERRRMQDVANDVIEGSITP
ncbi:MAG: response regulator [Actinobacteria bacterium]|nr:response regulator [Actinomycetota bacterium]